MSKKKVAVILSGCGVYDGSEIYETSLVLLSLDRAGISYQCMAPNIEQMHVINHMTGEEMRESRNVLVESARLARGEIIDLADANPEDYDGLVFPGGFGAAKNLSNFAVKGADMIVNEQVLAFAQTVHKKGKVIGLVCIAPALAPKIIGTGVQCTIGSDADTAAAITSMGGVHINCSVDAYVLDEDNNLLTTPAYMLAASISEAAEGIESLVQAFVQRL